jgi:hypothetical protein
VTTVTHGDRAIILRAYDGRQVAVDRRARARRSSKEDQVTHDRRAAALWGAGALLLLTVTACSAPAETAASSATSASRTSATAGLSPGEYGAPVDPSAPNPTAVATDVPATVSARPNASIFITYSGWDASNRVVEVDGYVQQVVEDGGTCTLTLTKGGASATASRPATPDVSSTSCGALTVPAGQLSSGTWSAVVSYASSKSQGSSAPVDVPVP